MASVNEGAKSVLIFVAPGDGTGGVGDYAEHVLSDLRGMFDEVYEIRTHGPEADSIREIRAWRRQLRGLERRHGVQNTVVHAELASGSVGPFWVLRASRSARRSAVIHDAPLPVWWPLRNRDVIAVVTRHWRLLLWYDRFERRILGRFLGKLERETLRDVKVVALSDIGARRISESLRGASVLSGRHYVPSVPVGDIVPVAERPLAVGLFGHVYGGKGFELLSQLRIEIPDEIEIRIAGRGTSALPKMRGVTILGTVDGPAEVEFFNSIRVLMLPYNRVHGIRPVYPASGAAARAFAFHTPVVSSRSGTFQEAALDGGMIAADGLEGLVAAVVSLVQDVPRLEKLQGETSQIATERNVRGSLTSLVELWSNWVAEIRVADKPAPRL